MAEIRRQEFVVSLADIAAFPDKIPAENEFIYVRQSDGKLKLKCGDGITAISQLPYAIDIGAMEQAVIDAETAQGKAEEARDDAEGYAAQIDVAISAAVEPVTSQLADINDLLSAMTTEIDAIWEVN